MKCPKCNREMREGVFLAPTVRGSFLTWWDKVKRKLLIPDSLQIKAYRCKNCGYLESYAK